jgi:hypothetical protein
MMAETLLTEIERTKAHRLTTDSLGTDSLAVGLLAADEITASRAKEVLSCSRIYALRRLFVEQDGEAVVLRGRVESFYHKQLAQELVRAAIDGVELVNRINVVYGRDRNAASVDW